MIPNESGFYSFSRPIHSNGACRSCSFNLKEKYNFEIKFEKKNLKKNTLFAGSTCSGGDKSSVVLMDIVEPDLSRLDKLNLEAALFKDLPRDVCETDFLKDHLQEMMMLKDEQEKVLKMSS